LNINKRIKLEESKQKELVMIKETVGLQKSKEELAYELEMGVVLAEY